MMQLDLDDRECTVLMETLRAQLSDMSVEIAGTDRKEYRDEIKAERRVLRAILARLRESSS